jgi:hypothetical protein
MMRLVRMCLGLPLVFGLIVMAGQQTQPATAQNAAQSAAAKQPSGQASQSAATKLKKRHRAARRGYSKAAARNGAKRAAYRPEYTDNTVEVINGDATKKVVFHNEQPATASAKNLPAALKNAPPPMKVEVVNGTTTDTQYFNDQGQQVAADSKQPVVVGIQSSDTRVVGGNKNPVVTSVASSGTGTAKSASKGGQPVAKRVSPKPKRPAYQPDAH